MKLASVLSLLLLGACDLHLEAITAPPPGATATLDQDGQCITLSRGAALAVACDDGGGLCDSMLLLVGDPDVAGARVAYRNALDFTLAGPQPATSFVIYGKSAGSTYITVDSAGGSATYDVVVTD